MKPTTFALAVVAALIAAPATAAAKEPIAASVCGDDGCVPVEEKRDLNVLVNGGPPEDPPIRPAAFYRIRMTFGDGRDDGIRVTGTTFYVPSRGMLGGDGPFGGLVWWPADRAERRLLDGLTASLTPFPAPNVTAVRVSDRILRGGDLSAWLAVYGGLAPAGDDLPAGAWYDLEIVADRRTPWTDGRLAFSVIPAGDLVRREGELFRLPPALAAEVDALAPPEPAPEPASRPAAPDDGRLPLALLVAGVACLPLLFAAALGARRRTLGAGR